MTISLPRIRARKAQTAQFPIANPKTEVNNEPQNARDVDELKLSKSLRKQIGPPALP